MILSEIAVGARFGMPKEAEFNGGTHSIESMYVAQLGRFRTKCTGKVYIELWEGPPADVEFANLIDVVMVRRPFDFEAYWHMDLEMRKRTILEVIREEMVKVARRMGWPFAPFEEAYQGVLAMNLVHEFFCGKAATSPNRKRKARVWCHFDVERIDVYVIFYDKAGRELGRRLAATTLPHDFFLYHALGTFGWIDDATVVLAPKLEGEVIRIKSPE